ncbi:MAG: hypothetical protein Q9208_007377 [Pyrenodesmia sp. 3 TL-2023]
MAEHTLRRQPGATSPIDLLDISNANGHIDTKDEHASASETTYHGHQYDHAEATKHQGNSLVRLIKGPIPSLPKELLNLLPRPRRSALSETQKGSVKSDQTYSATHLPAQILLDPGLGRSANGNKDHHSTNESSEARQMEDTDPFGINQHHIPSSANIKGKSPALDIHQQGVQVPELKTLRTEFQAIDESVGAGADPLYPTIALGDKYFVCAQMPIPREDIDLWESRIREPLKKALLCMSSETDDYEAYGCIEFYMAGKRRDNLKPCVIITCCSNKRRKELRRILSKLEWLKITGLKWIVIVDKSFGYRTSTHLRDSYGVAFTVECRNLHQTTQSCGFQARLVSHSPRPSGQFLMAFTIGGFVLVDEKLYGLTTAHPLFPCAHHDSDDSDSPSADSDSSDKSDGEMNGSPSVGNSRFVTCSNGTTPNLGSMSQIHSQSNAMASESIPGIHDRISDGSGVQFKTLGQVVHSALDSSNDSQTCDDDRIHRHQDHQDWALVSVEKHSCQLNIVHLPGDINPIVIQDTIAESEQSAGKVWILTGHGPVKGELSPLTVSMQLGRSSFDVQQITTERSISMLRLMRP